MLGEVISTAGPNHTNCCDRYNFMAKFNLNLPLSIPFNFKMFILTKAWLGALKTRNKQEM